MESILVKHHQYEVMEILSSDSYKCLLKNKYFFVKVFDLEKSENKSKFLSYLKLHQSNISLPKLYAFDKKRGVVVLQFLDGQLVSDFILDHDFNENLYRQIFRNSYMARIVKLNLDYSLDKWMLCGDSIFYVGFSSEPYVQENDFTKIKIREWFLSKELSQFYKNNGILFDKSRILDDFKVNKEMVLMTCKYYQ